MLCQQVLLPAEPALQLLLTAFKDYTFECFFFGFPQKWFLLCLNFYLFYLGFVEFGEFMV